MKATPTPTSNANSSGGKIVVIGIFGVALLAALAGLAYKYVASQQPLELWGAEGIQVIQSAPQVELLTISTADQNVEGPTLQFGDQSIRIVATKDISKAPGLIHHRHFLTESVSYTMHPIQTKETRSWSYAVKFLDSPREVIVLFDLPGKRLANLQTHREVQLNPQIAENWQRFVSRELAAGMK